MEAGINGKAMYTGIYAPWENIPKFLKHEETVRPIGVLDDFFQIDSVAGHTARFKEWRDHAVSDEYYENERNGPGALLYTWQDHVKLVEAVYLLWHEHRNTVGKPSVTTEQLMKEKAEWEYFPVNLDEHQLVDPYNVIEQLFDDYDLAVLRDHLYEWLEMALTETSNYDPTLSAQEVISIYEHMLSLYDASWVIYQRESGEPERLRSIKVRSAVAAIEPSKENPESLTSNIHLVNTVPETIQQQTYFLRPLYPQPTPAEKLGLQKIKEVILQRFPTVLMIAFLGSSNSPFTYFLLILVSDKETREEGNLSCDIENHLQYLSQTHVILHKSAGALESMKSGNCFWNNALTHVHIIHQAQTLTLPPAHEITGKPLADIARGQWGLWGRQGEELIEGAAFYIERHNLRLAAFTLHKATETILKAIIQSVTGYRIQMHNIGRLLRLTLLFTTELKQAFQLDATESIQEFAFLKEAYARSHYSENFDPDETTINVIYEKVKALHQSAERVFQQFVAEHDR